MKYLFKMTFILTVVLISMVVSRTPAVAADDFNYTVNTCMSWASLYSDNLGAEMRIQDENSLGFSVTFHDSNVYMANIELRKYFEKNMFNGSFISANAYHEYVNKGDDYFFDKDRNLFGFAIGNKRLYSSGITLEWGVPFVRTHEHSGWFPFIYGKIGYSW